MLYLRQIVLLAVILMASPVQAVIETYEFSDDSLRHRYQVFVEELRCPKCQNQNLEDSNAGVAADLRREVYRLLNEGYSDDEITDYMVARYGEFILYRPKASGITLWLWLAPAGLLLIAIVGVFVFVRRHRSGATSAESTLTEQEQQRLSALLQNPGVGEKDS